MRGGEERVGAAAPAPLGALGRAVAQAVAPAQMVVAAVTLLLAGGAIAVVLPWLATTLATPLGVVPTIWVLAAIALATYAAAVLAIALLPPLLVPARDRAAFAVSVWAGAREVRRVLGSAGASMSLPTSPAAAERWLRSTPPAPELRSLRVDVLLLAGRIDEARAEIALLPGATPFERYKRVEAEALADDQDGRVPDLAALRAAVASIPPGPDRVEAAAGLAILRARRTLPDPAWRDPLLEVRPAIPGSTASIIVRDHGLVVAGVLLRRTGPVLAGVVVLIAAIVTAGALDLR